MIVFFSLSALPAPQPPLPRDEGQGGGRGGWASGLRRELVPEWIIPFDTAEMRALLVGEMVAKACKAAPARFIQTKLWRHQRAHSLETDEESIPIKRKPFASKRCGVAEASRSG